MSNLSESLTVTFFVKSDGSEMLKSLKKKNEQRAIGAIRSWA